MREAGSTLITNWIMDQLRTDAGGYTRAVTAALGVSWPLTTGWKRRLIGTKIDNWRLEQAFAFRDGWGGQGCGGSSQKKFPKKKSKFKRYNAVAAKYGMKAAYNQRGCCWDITRGSRLIATVVPCGQNLLVRLDGDAGSAVLPEFRDAFKFFKDRGVAA